MLLEIAQYGNPVLKEKCRPVEHFDDSLKTLAENMLETMYAAEGIGLAAPQVSIPIQLVVIDIPKEEESVTWLKVNGEDKELSDIMPLMFANPVLEPYGPMHPFHEGCLSVMKIRASVVRPDFVKATVLLIDGREITIDCNGLLARCLRHPFCGARFFRTEDYPAQQIEASGIGILAFRDFPQAFMAAKGGGQRRPHSGTAKFLQPGTVP